MPVRRRLPAGRSRENESPSVAPCPQSPGHALRANRAIYRTSVRSGYGGYGRGIDSATTQIKPSPLGLSEAEAQRRLAARGPVEPPASSRSYASIVRANVFTVF